jgi:hypothetical protein
MINWKSGELLNEIICAQMNHRSWNSVGNEWLQFARVGDIQILDVCTLEKERRILEFMNDTLESEDISVKSLMFLDYQASPEFLASLLNGSRFQTLSLLGFCHGMFYSEHVETLVQFLQRGTLSTLILDCASLEQRDVSKLLQPLFSTGICGLYLRYLDYIPRELVDINQIASLRELCLDWCLLEGPYMIPMFEGLETNLSLQHLNLSHVRFTTESCKAFVKMLTFNKHLRHLTIYPHDECSGVEWFRWMARLTKGLSRNATLERLHTDLDYFAEYGLPEQIHKNCTLLSIGQVFDDFDGINWDGMERNHRLEDARARIAREALKTSRKLMLLQYPPELNQLILERMLIHAFPFDYELLARMLSRRDLLGIVGDQPFSGRNLIRECYRLSLIHV